MSVSSVGRLLPFSMRLKITWDFVHIILKLFIVAQESSLIRRIFHENETRLEQWALLSSIVALIYRFGNVLILKNLHGLQHSRLLEKHKRSMTLHYTMRDYASHDAPPSSNTPPIITNRFLLIMTSILHLSLLNQLLGSQIG